MSTDFQPRFSIKAMASVAIREIDSSTFAFFATIEEPISLIVSLQSRVNIPRRILADRPVIEEEHCPIELFSNNPTGVVHRYEFTCSVFTERLANNLPVLETHRHAVDNDKRTDLFR